MIYDLKQKFQDNVFKITGNGHVLAFFAIAFVEEMLITCITPSLPSGKSLPYRVFSACATSRAFITQNKQVQSYCSCHSFNHSSGENSYISLSDENSRRKILLFFLSTTVLFPTRHSSAKTKSKNPYDERRLLEQNKRRQRENNAPDDFPSFVREGFEVKVIAPEIYVKRDSGLIYWDIEVGNGDCPKDGQQVTFHYVGYNESGRRIDSTYLQGSPAKIRVGTNSLVPGFEEGIRGMRPGGKRRIIIPPELGPPVGPSTFFSSKQFEVFDVELLNVQDCQRRTIGFYSDIVCN